MLADWLADWIKTVQPYSNAILGGVLLITVAIVAVILWAQKSKADTAQAWEDVFVALSSGRPGELDSVSEQYEDSNVVNSANLIAGELHLEDGCNQRFISRSGAEHELAKAWDNFQAVLENTRKPEFRERATFGVARVHDARGEMNKAIEQYGKVREQWPEGVYVVRAGRNMKNLQRSSTKAFCDNFAEFDPRPAFADELLMPGTRIPFDDSSLPDSFPDSFPDSLPNDEDLFKPLDPLELKQEADKPPAMGDAPNKDE